MLAVAWALAGAALGSAINVLVYRLPLMMHASWQAEARDGAPFNLAVPRSHCPECKATVPWHLNIPLVSWLLLRGRCRFCRQPIPWRYPLVELLGAAAAGYALWAHYPLLGTAAALGFLLLALLAMAAIDAHSGLLPDSLTLTTLWAGLLAAVAGWSGVAPADAVLGAAGGYLALRAPAELYLLARRQEGMGGGDWKMFAAIGAWLGWAALPAVLLLACVAGALWVLPQLPRLLREGGLGEASIPFGPPLALGALALLLWGPQIRGLLFPA